MGRGGEGERIGWRSKLSRVLRGRPDGVRARLAERLRPRRASGSAVASGSPPPGPPAPEAPAQPPAPGFVRVMEARALAPGHVVEALVGDEPVAVANVGGSFYAITDICPHAGGPLGDGSLEGSTLTCPYHGWTFDVRTGACHVDGALGLDTYEVVLADGAIWIRLPGARPGS